MKKKMGILVGLLMATVVTGYSVGGTYAKYTSTLDFTDTARVAQWQLQAQDAATSTVTDKLNLFSDSYSVNEKGLYVKSIDDGKVVAPGTKGEYQINFAGNMEVRYMLNIQLTSEKEPGTNYAFKTDAGTVTGWYDPIVYKVTLFDGAKGETYLTATGSFDEVVEAIEVYNTVTQTEYEPGRLNLSLKIEWSWDAENEIDGLTREQVDSLDTLIGEELSVTENYDDEGNYTGSSFNYGEYKLTVTATQVAENHAVRS